MHFLYGSKSGAARRLVATFDSEPQLRAYVRWATLESTGKRRGKFEQGSVLAGCSGWEQAAERPVDEGDTDVPHNPTPSML